jgi:hypothetical protein
MAVVGVMIGYQISGTFGGRFGLPTNFNAKQWQIPTKVRARMKNLNAETIYGF